MEDRFHANIKKHREARGLTQDKMADALGIARTTYINFETGKTKLFCKPLEKLSEYLNIAEEEILLDAKIDEEYLRDTNASNERIRTLTNEYEDRIARLQDELSALKADLSSKNAQIEYLTRTGEYLLNQLNKE